jgi:hypothetical protein
MSLLHILDELDQMQRHLEEEFPECKIGYSYQPGHVTWIIRNRLIWHMDRSVACGLAYQYCDPNFLIAEYV